MKGVMKRSTDVDKATTPEPALGFHAQLHGAGLWDLVQMECLARSRLVVEVTGEGGIGYLYFDAGRVIHAVTPRLRGEPAALEILSWTHGSFQACERAWPSAPTIDMTHEGLILQIAKRRDEENSSNLVAFPGRSGIEAVVEAALDEIELLEIEEEGEEDMRSSNTDDTPASPVAPVPRTEVAADFPVMLRLGPTGATIRNKGGSDELPEAVAYAHRLLQLTGELLGLDTFTAIECTFTDGSHTLIFAEDGGEIVALKPRAEVNLQPLRERLGL
jgi:hypothetical protein